MFFATVPETEIYLATIVSKSLQLAEDTDNFKLQIGSPLNEAFRTSTRQDSGYRSGRDSTVSSASQKSLQVVEISDEDIV